MRGLVAPRQEPLIQANVGGLLWQRPLQAQLVHCSWASLGGKSEEREGWSCSLKRKLSASAERKDSYPYSGDIPSRWVPFQHGRRPNMKHTHSDRQQHAGKPCTGNSFGAAFTTTARKNVLFWAFARCRQGTVRPRLLQVLSGESTGRSAESRTCSTAKAGQRREG